MSAYERDRARARFILQHVTASRDAALPWSSRLWHAHMAHALLDPATAATHY